MTGCPQFFNRLAAAAAPLGADEVLLISDPGAAMLSVLTRLALTEPLSLSDPRIDGDCWYADLADYNGDGN